MNNDIYAWVKRWKIQEEGGPITCYSINVKILPESIYELFWSYCNIDEHEKALRYNAVEDRKLSILGRGLLRWSVSQQLNDSDPRKWKIARDKLNRPYLVPSGNFIMPDVNISHCHGEVACVIGHGARYGVDVETVKPASRYGSIMSSVLTTCERDWVYKGTASERSLRFLKIWTLKEAITKATGAGLTTHFSSIELDVEPKVYLRKMPSHDPARFRLWQKMLDTGAVLSVASLENSPSWDETK